MEATRRLPRVVIAEDDDDMRTVLCELVSTLGVEVMPASSGGDLVLLLTGNEPVDLLITDVRMPWMTGLQVAVSARNSGMGVPIIVVTAFPEDALRDQVDHLGGAVLLAKPFRPEELLSLVRARLPASGAAV
jgi:DNA-binding response OmpR family regulator